MPKPLPGQAHADALTAYVGKYPTDAVDGVGFYDRTEVARALNDAVGDERIRRRFVNRDAVTVPIFRTADGRIAAHGCMPHDCGDNDWTLMLGADGSRPAAAVVPPRVRGRAGRGAAGLPRRAVGDDPGA